MSEEKIETTGKSVKLKLTLNNKIEYANGRDLALLTCVCVDENGREVPDAEAFIKFSANKLGAVVGTGSDISDHIPPSCPDRKMRAGILKVYAFGENLDTAVIDIPLKKVQN